MMFAEVGLNVISHLKQSMDQFAPDMDEHYDLEPGVARPMLSAFDRFAFLLFSFILRCSGCHIGVRTIYY